MTKTQAPGNGDDRDRDFAAEAGKRRPGLVAELREFLAHNKKWWLLPIVVMLLVIGALILVSGTVAAPFIYPLF